jgi:hypothetical protein
MRFSPGSWKPDRKSLPGRSVSGRSSNVPPSDDVACASLISAAGAAFAAQLPSAPPETLGDACADEARAITKASSAKLLGSELNQVLA